MLAKENTFKFNSVAPPTRISLFSEFVRQISSDYFEKMNSLLHWSIQEPTIPKCEKIKKNENEKEEMKGEQRKLTI